MKTEKLYLKDVYLKKADCQVINVFKTEDECKALNQKFKEGTALVELKQSLFFPEGGGQPWDLGTIGGHAVLEVTEDKATGTVWHRVTLNEGELSGDQGATLMPGSSVCCVLDWQRRFDHMQMHCGEHVLSGAFAMLYGVENKGFHMGEDYMTIDMDLPEGSEYEEITADMAASAELLANEIVWSDVPVTTMWFDTKEEANEKPVRKAIKFDEDISVVFIGDVEHPKDCVACCGTHPSTTGQIGLIKIVKAEKYKGMMRYTIKAGRPAFEDMRLRSSIVQELCNKYSTEADDLLHRMAVQEEKNGAVRKELHDMKKLLSDKEVQRLRVAIPDMFASGESSIVIQHYDLYGADDIQTIGLALNMELPCVVALAADRENTVILLSKGTPSAGSLVKEYASMYNGKGGGNAKLARAIFTKREDMELFLDLIEKHLR